MSIEPVGTLSFAQDIRPLFRMKDVNAMRNFGAFDLSKHADVSEFADAILERLAAGTMPCDEAWPTGQVAQFRKWIEDGKNP